MIRKIFTLIIVLTSAYSSFAQYGEIRGRITDGENGEGIPFANIIALQSEAQKAGATTDFDGNFSIKPLSPGKYDLKVTYVGYQPTETKGVLVSSDKFVIVNFSLNKGIKLTEVEITEYKIPLFSKDETATGQTLTKDEITKMPYRSINSFVSAAAGVSQADEGKNVYVRGSRADANVYIIDGVKVRGSSTLPVSAIDQIEVITGGTPAKYGDVSGGIMAITTRGPSKNVSGGVELITSTLFDKYGHNIVSGNISGPILMKNKGTAQERPLLGYFIAGEFQADKDNSPSAIGNWKVKDSKLEELKSNPLVKNGNTFTTAVSYIKMDDLEKIKARNNVASNNIRLDSKFDLAINDKMNLTFGGSLARNYGRTGEYAYKLFNWDNYGEQISTTWRTYARFTHKISKAKNDKEKSASIFQDVYYTVQVDYEKYHIDRHDKRFKDKVFEYGHIGSFASYKTPNIANVDSIWVKDSTGNYIQLLNVSVQSGFKDDSVDYVAGTENPDLAKITSSYLFLTGDNSSVFYGDANNSIQSSIEGIRGSGYGLVNGQNGGSAYGMWSMPGTVRNGYLLQDNNQLRGTITGSFDISPNKKGGDKEKHSIQIGFEVEKRTDRFYNLGPVGLWTKMREETNKHILGLDTSNPTIVYGTTDTVIYYPRKFDANLQTFFDKQLRDKLGLAANGLDFIDIDNLLPETFSMDMFSADELLNNGSEYATYYGYDHTGKKLKKQPKFEDFWKEKDENGNYTRAQGAFTPIYMAAYIEDKFSFKDLVFNVGLRVDRYDANQMVLKDRYSLYPIKTKSDVSGSLNKDNNGSHPSNIDNNYAVYVDNTITPTKIVGYRDGDVWYSTVGSRINDPEELKKLAGGNLNPYLVDPDLDIKSASFDPSKSFTDYKPQYSYMPRIAFSFPISDEAMFIAHYDVLTQRPTWGDFFLQSPNIMTPESYYFLQEKVNSVTFTNPNLKPQRNIDYQVGFKQKTSKSSVFTISGFYREIKDMVAQRKFVGAYPVEYTSYDNRDFGTIKGLTFAYDLRRTTNATLKLNYTLQFADGTGSDAFSQSNLLSIGQPNLRTIYPLVYDQRHIIVTTFDYRFPRGTDYNGPKGWSKNVFEGAGLDLAIRGASGYPYSKYSLPTSVTNTDQRFITKKGDPQGSRLPWTFKVDLRVDKDFDINLTKKQTGKRQKKLSMNAYLLVQNVLNTKNVLGVYQFTGSPSDDGYLSSPQGQDEIKKATPDSQSFTDLYKVYLKDPGNYSLPRLVNLGIIANF